MVFDPIATRREWKQKVASLQQRWRGARRENEQLRQENEQLRRREKQLEQEREQLRQEVEKLKRQLEQAQPAGKRQAAPFSRGTRKQESENAGTQVGFRLWPAAQQSHSPKCRRSDRRIPSRAV